MPQRAWSAKRERQYTHINHNLLGSCKPGPMSKEVAARVDNQEGAQLEAALAQ
jgi:hypothetical protein